MKSTLVLIRGSLLSIKVGSVDHYLSEANLTVFLGIGVASTSTGFTGVDGILG